MATQQGVAHQRGSSTRAADAADDCRLDRRLHLFSLALHSAAQTASLSAWATLPDSEKAQRLGSILLLAMFWAAARLAPRLYRR